MLIVGNWKAYVEELSKAKRLFAAAKKLGQAGKHDIVLAPPAPFLGVLAAGNRSSVEFAGQDVSATLGGKTTGEITAGVLEEAGATYVIVGHSERRAMGESDALILEKTRHALAHGLTPILCIGEKERDPEAQYLTLLRSQLGAVIGALSQKERMGVVIAYEPLWAIGKTAEDAIAPGDLNEMVLYIRKLLSDYLPGKASTKVRILYGGAVEGVNARELAATASIDGFLVGRASTDVTSFSTLVKALS